MVHGAQFLDAMVQPIDVATRPAVCSSNPVDTAPETDAAGDAPPAELPSAPDDDVVKQFVFAVWMVNCTHDPASGQRSC